MLPAAVCSKEQASWKISNSWVSRNDDAIFLCFVIDRLASAWSSGVKKFSIQYGGISNSMNVNLTYDGISRILRGVEFKYLFTNPNIIFQNFHQPHMFMKIFCVNFTCPAGKSSSPGHRGSGILHPRKYIKIGLQYLFSISYLAITSYKPDKLHTILYSCVYVQCTYRYRPKQPQLTC